MGAAIFDALEGPNNEKVKEGLVQLRENLKMKYKMNEDDYKMIEVLIEEKKPHKTGPQWKFAGSLYYAFVTLALIGRRNWSVIVLDKMKSPGYGHSTPSTMLGKVFTMAYSVVGIPLALIMFQVPRSAKISILVIPFRLAEHRREDEQVQQHHHTETENLVRLPAERGH